MNRTLIAKDAEAALSKRGFDVNASDEQVEIGFPGLLIIVDASASRRTSGWIWRRYGDVPLDRMDSEDIDRNAAFEAHVKTSDDSLEAGVKSVLLCLRELLAGYLDVIMVDHVEHVREQADLGKGGMTEGEMAALGLLDVEGINCLNEALAQVDEEIKSR